MDDDPKKECANLHTRIALLEERLRGRDAALEIAQKQYPTQRDFIDLKAEVDKKIAEGTGWVKLVALGSALGSIITAILMFAR